MARASQAKARGKLAAHRGPSHEQSTAKTPGRHGQAVDAGCRKTLISVEAVLVTPTKRVVAEDLTAGLWAPASETAIAPCVWACGSCRITWQNYRLPPPTDLVIVHQQFLI